MARRQGAKLLTTIGEKRIATDHKAAPAQLEKICKYRVEIAFTRGMQDVKLQPQRVSCRLRVSRVSVGKN
jgi:hypothetical protein